MSDFLLSTPQRLIRPVPGFLVQPVTFILMMDAVAQEINETFTLKLVYETSLFGPNDEVRDELNVTIIDADSKILA